MKAGVRTSEFWLTIIAMLGTLAAGAAKLVPPHWAAILETAAAIFYTVSRSVVKAANGGK